MTRWSTKDRDFVETPEIDAFLADIEAVCRAHGMSISHEDHYGGFEVCPFNERYLEWLRNAAAVDLP